MGGRFGKYGDLKRRRALQRGRKEISGFDKSRRHKALRNADGWLPTSQAPAEDPAAKTHKSAVVVIPPEEIWGPIQGLRRQYDRHYRRWMPHITLLYPFRWGTDIPQLIPSMARACRKVEPFEVRLTRFDLFTHSRRSATLFLIPEPADALKKIHNALLAVAPDCDDVSRFAGGFHPHLSVGQLPGRQARDIRDRWQATWRPLVFTLTYIHIIQRNQPPDDVFRIVRSLPLGRSLKNADQRPQIYGTRSKS
jgi:2'-5' RNA ligase